MDARGYRQQSDADVVRHQVGGEGSLHTFEAVFAGAFFLRHARRRPANRVSGERQQYGFHIRILM